MAIASLHSGPPFKSPLPFAVLGMVTSTHPLVASLHPGHPYKTAFKLSSSEPARTCRLFFTKVLMNTPEYDQPQANATAGLGWPPHLPPLLPDIQPLCQNPLGERQPPPPCPPPPPPSDPQMFSDCGVLTFVHIKGL